MRTVGLIFVGSIVVSAIVVIACRPDGGLADGLPATEDGLSEIQIVAPCTRNLAFTGFTDTTTTATVLQLPAAIPYEHLFWRASALDSIGAVNDAGGPYYLPPNSGNGGINLPAYTLDSTKAAPMCARFGSTVVPMFACGGELRGQTEPLYQQEAFFHARDPNELFYELESPDFVFGSFGCDWTEDSNGCVQAADTEWNQEVSASYLPRVISIPYPPLPNTPRITEPNVAEPLAGYLWNTGDLSEADFWPTGGATPAGPALMPTGASSIKAVSVVQHGYCSQYLAPSTAIFKTLADQLWAQYQSAIQSNDVCSCIDVGRDFIHLAPFFEPPQNSSTDQVGGFFLNAAFRNHFAGSGYLGFTDDSARANVAYQWSLTNEGGVVSDMTAYPPRHIDGRILPSTLYSQYSADGHDGTVLEQTLSSAITSQIPEALYESSDQGLVYTGPTITSPDNPEDAILCPSHDPDNCYPCSPGAIFGAGSYPTGDPDVPVVPDVSVSGPGVQCNDSTTAPGGGFMETLRQNIIGGAQALGWSTADLDVNVPSSAINTVLNTAFAHNGDDGSGSGYYDRIRCNSYHSAAKNKDIARCEYVIPVKRVVSMPDQLELVFLDNDRELANPAMTPYLVASYYDSLSATNGQSEHPGSPFCQRSGPCGPPPAPDAGIIGAVSNHIPPLLLNGQDKYLTRNYSKYSVGSTTVTHNGDFCDIPGSCDAYVLGLSYNGLGAALGINWLVWGGL